MKYVRMNLFGKVVTAQVSDDTTAESITAIDTAATNIEFSETPFQPEPVTAATLAGVAGIFVGATTLADAKDITLRLLAERAGKLLGETDWYYIRRLETSNPVPADVQAARSAIRSQLTTKQANVNAATSTTAIVALFQPNTAKQPTILTFTA